MRKKKQVERINKLLKSNLTYKRLPRQSSKVSVVVKEPEVENIFDDENRFFNREWEDTKKSMFLK